MGAGLFHSSSQAVSTRKAHGAPSSGWTSRKNNALPRSARSVPMSGGKSGQPDAEPGMKRVRGVQRLNMPRTGVRGFSQDGCCCRPGGSAENQHGPISRVRLGRGRIASRRAVAAANGINGCCTAPIGSKPVCRTATLSRTGQAAYSRRGACGPHRLSERLGADCKNQGNPQDHMHIISPAQACSSRPVPGHFLRKH